MTKQLTISCSFLPSLRGGGRDYLLHIALIVAEAALPISSYFGVLYGLYLDIAWRFEWVTPLAGKGRAYRQIGCYKHSKTTVRERGGWSSNTPNNVNNRDCMFANPREGSDSQKLAKNKSVIYSFIQCIRLCYDIYGLREVCQVCCGYLLIQTRPTVQQRN